MPSDSVIRLKLEVVITFCHYVLIRTLSLRMLQNFASLKVTRYQLLVPSVGCFVPEFQLLMVNDGPE